MGNRIEGMHIMITKDGLKKEPIIQKLYWQGWAKTR